VSSRLVRRSSPTARQRSKWSGGDRSWLEACFRSTHHVHAISNGCCRASCVPPLLHLSLTTWYPSKHPKIFSASYPSSFVSFMLSEKVQAASHDPHFIFAAHAEKSTC
jgi:hypothetical protein